MEKKGQISLNQAPSVILIVGLVFLIMATIAFVGEKYQDSLSTTTTTVNNETLTSVTEDGKYVSTIGACNFGSFTVVTVTNATGGEVIDSGEYTATASTGLLASTGGSYNNTDWNVTYTYASSGTACNVTNDLQSEIASNVSIAGIVLTISLVGIVLTVLIGVFVSYRRRI